MSANSSLILRWLFGLVGQVGQVRRVRRVRWVGQVRQVRQEQIHIKGLEQISLL